MDRQWTFTNFTNTLQVSGCHFGIKPPAWTYPKHHHHLIELVCCLDGEVRQQFGQDTLSMKQGDWLLIKSGVKHAIVNDSDLPYVFFNLHFDLDDSEMRRIFGVEPYQFISGRTASDSLLPAYVRQLEAVLGQSIAGNQLSGSPKEEHVSLGVQDRLAVQAHILLIISEMIGLLKEQTINEEPVHDATQFTAEIAHRMEELLSANLYSDITIAEIAKRMNMSRFQCSKVFSHIYGVSPRQFLSELKLNEAKRLLVTTDQSVAAIAELLGFHSATHFSRQFRRWTGQSPNHFRPKHAVEPSSLKGRDGHI
ncbi:AraC family transcriptional regulator [Paenibacillus sp. RC67]|uniref:helix-turn-helix domain-containing protein n=1 Tax=Paenibacillus sp. RC67 TaxID=3039392 RepID=UPI0024ADB370|nr:AraC family transcriptional regulator [Paenibacillus sp. RC67]